MLSLLKLLRKLDAEVIRDAEASEDAKVAEDADCGGC
jgi:hypothetical protein